MTMTIDKAIELLKGVTGWIDPNDPPDDRDAIQMGIEALKRIKSARDNPSVTSLTTLLPGETEE